MNNDIIVNFEDNKDIEIKLENKTYLNLQNKTITPTTEEQIITSDSGYDGLKEVTIKAIILQSKNASPSSNQQEIEPDENYDGLSKVIIRAMQLELFSITPRTYDQTLTPSQNYDAIARVVINKVTADIDPNIVAENIKAGVSILGVEGNYDTPAYEGSYEITQNGTLATANKKMTQDLVVNVASTGVDVVSTYTSVPQDAYRQTNITSFTSSTIISLALGSFRDCSNLVSVYAPSVVVTGNNVFFGCVNLKNVYMKGNDNYGILAGTFCDCSSLEKVALAHTNVLALANTQATTIPRNTPPVKFYVPSSLISSYQTATNWSTLYNNGYIEFVDIETWGD